MNQRAGWRRKMSAITLQIQSCVGLDFPAPYHERFHRSSSTVVGLDVRSSSSLYDSSIIKMAFEYRSAKVSWKSEVRPSAHLESSMRTDMDRV